MDEPYGFGQDSIRGEDAQLYVIENVPGEPAAPVQLRLASSVRAARPLIQQAIFLLAASRTSADFAGFRAYFELNSRFGEKLEESALQAWLSLGSCPQQPGDSGLAAWLSRGQSVSRGIHRALFNSRPKSAEAILDLHWLAMYSGRVYENRGDALYSLSKEVDRALSSASKLGVLVTNAAEISGFFRSISKVSHIFKVSAVVS